jgi:hypothetical protein
VSTLVGAERVCGAYAHQLLCSPLKSGDGILRVPHLHRRQVRAVLYIYTYIHVYVIHAYICIYIHTRARAHTHTHTLGDLRGHGAFLEQLGQREVANVAICKVHGHRTPLAHGYSLHLAFEVRELEQALFCGRLHKRRVLCVCVRVCVRAYTSHVQIHLYLMHCARNMHVCVRKQK